LQSDRFSKRYRTQKLSRDGFGEYVLGKDIELLWQLVPIVPPSTAHILLQKLPVGAGLSPDALNQVVNHLTDDQLETLLYRSDVELVSLRKKIFFEAGSDKDSLKKDLLKTAAITWHFNLEYSEFAAILAKPNAERRTILRDLAMSANDLSLCLYEAADDGLSQSEGLFDWEYGEWAEKALNAKARRLTGWQRQKELTELRLYRLAKQAVPWTAGVESDRVSSELKFLAKVILRDDAWGTFMAFSRAWSEKGQGRNLEEFLPHVDGLDIDATNPPAAT
jgi:hypothetical protein